MATGTSVLIVDDASAVRDRLRRLLESIRHVHVVGDAADATEAIRQIGEKQPRIVVLDLSLPGENGLAVLKSTRKLAAGAVFAVFSNYTGPQVAEECYRAGADFVFDKSADIDDLLAAIGGIAELDRTNGSA
ncbi:MAG: response regulator transcription factor [Bacteroidetes bacterium]|nr:response regulator transcription factor [Bacteroidota bacterium]